MSGYTLPDGYEVTDEGIVYSVASNWRGYGKRQLTQTPNSFGYPRVAVMVDGKKKLLFVHKIVAAHFLGPRPDGLQIRHLNGDKSDNRASNLAWGTAKENAADRALHGRTSAGAPHSEAIKRGFKKSVSRCV